MNIDRSIFRFSWRRALSEFAVIVIGVLTALAVNAWAERRHDAHLEREYLERIRDDLTLNVKSLRAAQTFYSRVSSRAAEAFSILAANSSANAESDLVVLYQASRGEVPDFVDATFQELISTGGLRLIRNIELREELVRAHLRFEGYISKFSAWRDRDPYRDRVRRLIPADVQSAIASACRLDAPNTGTCRNLVTSTRAQMILRRIKADSTLKDDLTLWLAAQASIRGATEAQLKSAEAVLNHVRQHLR